MGLNASTNNNIEKLKKQNILIEEMLAKRIIELENGNLILKDSVEYLNKLAELEINLKNQEDKYNNLLKEHNLLKEYIILKDCGEYNLEEFNAMLAMTKYSENLTELKDKTSILLKNMKKINADI